MQRCDAQTESGRGQEGREQKGGRERGVVKEVAAGEELARAARASRAGGADGPRVSSERMRASERRRSEAWSEVAREEVGALRWAGTGFRRRGRRGTQRGRERVISALLLRSTGRAAGGRGGAGRRTPKKTWTRSNEYSPSSRYARATSARCRPGAKARGGRREGPSVDGVLVRAGGRQAGHARRTSLLGMRWIAGLQARGHRRRTVS